MKRLPDYCCIDCGQLIDGAMCVEGDATPNPGDMTICIYCGHIMVFTEDHKLRNPNRAEQEQIAGDRRILAVQRARKEFSK